MKVYVFSLFGREVAKVAVEEHTTVHDLVRQMMARQEMADDVEFEYDDDELIQCECCGEMFNPDEDDDEDDDDIISSRFADMTERIVWDARTDDDEPPPELFQ